MPSPDPDPDPDPKPEPSPELEPRLDPETNHAPTNSTRARWNKCCMMVLLQEFQDIYYTSKVSCTVQWTKKCLMDFQPTPFRVRESNDPLLNWCRRSVGNFPVCDHPHLVRRCEFRGRTSCCSFTILDPNWGSQLSNSLLCPVRMAVIAKLFAYKRLAQWQLVLNLLSQTGFMVIAKEHLTLDNTACRK